MTATSSPPAASDSSDPGVGRDAPSGWRRWWAALGPGLVTGASDDDPSGVATYAQAGAKFGVGLLWTVLFTLPLMAAVQEICDRTALATGKSLGALARVRFAGAARGFIGVLIVALMMANILNVAADLVAIGQGVHLLHAGPAWIWALVAGLGITALLLAGGFEKIQHVFKILCLSLLVYIVVLFFADVPWGKVGLHTVVPHITFSKDYLSLLVAVLGTTISPYLFFWQTAHRVEEMRDEDLGGERAVPLKRRGAHQAKVRQRTARADVFSGMALSNIVMFAIITATAATLGKHSGTDVTSAAQAAQALKPVAGSLASTLFALGFIGSGMLAVPVLAGSGSAGLAGLLGKPWGMEKDVKKAPLFYALLALGTMGGTALTLVGLDPIKLLVFSAIVNGVAAVPFLVLVMVLSDSRRLMGKQRNGMLARILGWTATALMAVAAVAMLVLQFGG